MIPQILLYLGICGEIWHFIKATWCNLLCLVSGIFSRLGVRGDWFHSSNERNWSFSTAFAHDALILSLSV